jgi:hypothetical protein
MIGPRPGKATCTEFWERRKFFDTRGGTPSQQAAGLASRQVYITCPCCGFPTLNGRGMWEVCYLCSWEDDGQDTPQADDDRSGPNHGYSLVEARFNFERYIIMYPPDGDSRVGGSDSEEEKDFKRAIIHAFEQMISDPAAAKLASLWQAVGESRKGLEQELKRKISGPLYKQFPCPYCGAPLRTQLAKQCRKCRKDWHDPENIVML